MNNNHNKIIFILVLLLVITLFGGQFLLGERSESKKEINKLNKDIDSLQKVNTIISANLLRERKTIKELTKQDSLLTIQINKLDKEDKVLSQEQANIKDSYKGLTEHQLLDSLHKFYAKNH